MSNNTENRMSRSSGDNYNKQHHPNRQNVLTAFLTDMEQLLNEIKRAAEDSTLPSEVPKIASNALTTIYQELINSPLLQPTHKQSQNTSTSSQYH